jgi:hypothetical protein
MVISFTWITNFSPFSNLKYNNLRYCLLLNEFVVIYLYMVVSGEVIYEGFGCEFYLFICCRIWSSNLWRILPWILFICLFYVVEFGGVIYEGVCCEFHFLVQKLGLNFFGFRFDWNVRYYLLSIPLVYGCVFSMVYLWCGLTGMILFVWKNWFCI